MTRLMIRGRGVLAALIAAFALLACGGGATPSVAGSGAGAAAQTPQTLAQTFVQRSAQAPAASGATVVALIKQSETRVGRTIFDYVFKITVQNGNSALAGVTAQLTAVGAGTTIIDGSVVVGDMAANASVTPSDTITLRQDRSFPFNAAALIWQVSGTGSGAASLVLTPAQWVIGAGSALQVTPTVLDAAGHAITPAPAVSLSVAPIASGASGSLPTVSGSQVATSASTRGNYRVTGTVAGTAVTASLDFAVIQNASQSQNAAQYLALSGALGTAQQSLAQINQALANNDSAGAAAAAAALSAAGLTIDPHYLYFSTAYEPDLGFVPASSKLAANGFPATPGDAGYATASAQLRAKLQQITQLLTNPGPDSSANTALITQYQADLQAIANTLAGAGATPSPFGVADQAGAVSALLSQDMPLVLQAIASRAAAEVSSQAARRLVLSAGGGPTAHPAQFGLGGLLNALGPIGELINKIYGDYFRQIENMTIILAAKDLLDATVPQTVAVNGVFAGAALLGPYAYHYADSYLELSSGTSVATAQAADVYLIGGAAVQAVRDLLGSLQPPSAPTGPKDFFNYFKGILDALSAAQEAYDQAHQQPDFVISNNFENGGCLPDVADNCTEMHYNNGFENVSGGNVSFTVLILVRTGGPQPQIGSLVVNFAPGT